MDADPDSTNCRERYRDLIRSRGTRRHTERSSTRSRSHRSGSSRHDQDRQRSRNSDNDDRHGRFDDIAPAPEVRDRVRGSTGHRESASTKFRESGGYKEVPRSEERGRDVGHKSESSEEMKENSCKEEDKKECQQENIQQKMTVQVLAVKDEEESRRTEAVMPKSNDQQQVLKKEQVECVLCTNVTEYKTEHPKGDRSSMTNAGKPPARIEIIVNTRALANKSDRPTVKNLKIHTVVADLQTEPNERPYSGIQNSVKESTRALANKSERPTVKNLKIHTVVADLQREPNERPHSGIQNFVKEDLQTETNVHPDNWDDADGYYAYRLGELLGGRYEITALLGKGVFSRVVRAKDLVAGKGDPEKVAIKIIRSNSTMYKAGKQEVEILEKLTSSDREDRRHCVRFISNFRYRNHLCLVLESLHMNLREVLKKFGRNIGLKLTVVRIYAKQIFIALKHLKDCQVLHCDIKPENILVNEAKNVLKLCDFGNAMFAGKNEVTPYLVSRFYRAPEIILGLPYDHPLDMWSVGCCLYELCTGQVLFPGKSNNHMLRLHMELKGCFPRKMLRKGAFAMAHFNRDLNFQATDKDTGMNNGVPRLMFNIKPKGIGSYISNVPGEDPKTVSSFKDLLDKIFFLEPAKRLTVEQALLHPFITGK
jgi:serine/threonine-protein kinase PRP4